MLALMMTTNDLHAFFERGWNRHDESTAGPEACGTRHAGREHVRRAFARVFEVFPDARFAEARHLVAGARGLSEWRFTGTTAEGKSVEVDGCDLFTFAGDKIARKSAYFKTRTS